jgi:hypothetical protein
LSYIAYRCDPEYFAFLYRAVNRNNLIPALFDLAKRTQK